MIVLAVMNKGNYYFSNELVGMSLIVIIVVMET